MELNEGSILEDILEKPKRRRRLLPWWIKVFVWVFILTGAVIPIVVLMGIFGQEVKLSIFSLQTNHPTSATGIIISMLFLLKGIVAFGLWMEKDWAISLAIADAVINI